MLSGFTHHWCEAASFYHFDHLLLKQHCQIYVLIVEWKRRGALAQR
jgi:hypothetical protein